MRTLLALALLSAASLVLIGCDSAQVQHAQVQHVGPVRIVSATFDYYQTLEYPDGREFEFNHKGYEEALADEGATVEIDFIGDLYAKDFSNQVVSVKVLQHSAKYMDQHPELWPLRKGHWSGNSYILDDGTDRICGLVKDHQDIGEGWAASATYFPARESVYTAYANRDAAVKEVERVCQ